MQSTQKKNFTFRLCRSSSEVVMTFQTNHHQRKFASFAVLSLRLIVMWITFRGPHLCHRRIFKGVIWKFQGDSKQPHHHFTKNISTPTPIYKCWVYGGNSQILSSSFLNSFLNPRCGMQQCEIFRTRCSSVYISISPRKWFECYQENNRSSKVFVKNADPVRCTLWKFYWFITLVVCCLKSGVGFSSLKIVNNRLARHSRSGKHDRLGHRTVTRDF